MTTNDESNYPGLERITISSIQLLARYKHRIPCPGFCKVLSVDFENRTATISNGACRYFPNFDEIEFYERVES